VNGYLISNKEENIMAEERYAYYSEDEITEMLTEMRNEELENMSSEEQQEYFEDIDQAYKPQWGRQD
jgi:hypothetical protein